MAVDVSDLEPVYESRVLRAATLGRGVYEVVTNPTGPERQRRHLGAHILVCGGQIEFLKARRGGPQCRTSKCKAPPAGFGWSFLDPTVRHKCFVHAAKQRRTQAATAIFAGIAVSVYWVDEDFRLDYHLPYVFGILACFAVVAGVYLLDAWRISREGDRIH